MGRNVFLASFLVFAVVLFAACSTTNRASPADPDSGEVSTMGWQSPSGSSAAIPAARPVALKRAAPPPGDDVAALREANERLVRKVDELTEKVREIRTETGEPAAAEEPAAEPIAAPDAPRPAVTAPTVRAALASAGIESLSVSPTKAGLVAVTLHGSGSFGPGKASLSPEAKVTLTKLATVLRRDLAGARLRVEGHTDSDPIRKSNWASNEALSAARAAAVAECLTKAGGIESSRVESIGYGASRPVAPNTTTDGKARNRRVEIVILP